MASVSLNGYAAIIWDCDGVLIDSEILACSCVVDVLTEQGAHITLEDYLHRFMGKSDTQMLAEISFSGPFPQAQVKARRTELFAQHLKAISGIHDVLETSGIPMAVASGSPIERLQSSLGLTGLLKYFGTHIYSTEQVKNGKPAPDVFLLAAGKLGIHPKDCLVIEDSPHGVVAAKAADMKVFAFTGGSHITPAIRENLVKAKPDAIFNNMSELRRKAA
jgi:HAD superfamily hydrolase (TIGR01509 family)